MSNCTQPRNRVASLLPTPLAEVDALFNQFFPAGVGARVAREGLSAPASVWESETHLHVELDAPGVAQENVDVTFDKGQLAITLRRSDGRAADGDSAEAPPAYAYNERRFGEVTRTLTLPDSADPGAIEASLAAGVLRVSIGKRPESQPRRIDVRQN